MTVQTDDFLKMGGSHWMCEDYVISGIRPVPHVILSDGCSSSPGTDVGARLLVHAARSVFSEAEGLWCDGMENRIIHRTAEAGLRLGLPHTALDATLMIAARIGDIIQVRVFGDGCILAMDRESGLTVREIACDGNAPP